MAEKEIVKNSFVERLDDLQNWLKWSSSKLSYQLQRMYSNVLYSAIEKPQKLQP